MEPVLRERGRHAARRNAVARAILVERSEDSRLDPMPFIVGVPRSGTTLLRAMLDAHPSLAIPMETHFLPPVFDLAWEMGSDPNPNEMRARFRALLTGFPTWDHLEIDAAELSRALGDLEPFDLTGGLRLVYRLCAHEGEPRVGDKTPTYARHLPVVEALVPESHFIHIVRDGRDVCLSARDAPWSVARHWFPFGLDAEALAGQWRSDILLCRRLAVTSSHFLEVRYEDLLADPAAQLERICRFIALPYDEAMMRFHERAAERVIAPGRAALKEFLDREESGSAGRHSVVEKEEDGMSERLGGPVDRGQAGRWRSEMGDEDVEAFEAVAGDALARYGYELTGSAGS